MKGLIRKLLVLLVALAVANVEASNSQPTAAQRRSDMASKGRLLFKNTTDHCRSFRDLAAYAVSNESTVADLLEDLKFVLIGTELTRRGTGADYIGNTPGARGDKGFKPELQDNSPQVEHVWAAIYIGKLYPPGSTEAASLMTEVMGPLTEGGKLNAADVILWALGGDIGQRLSASNYKELPNVIQRTMCK